jgi:MFS family permease
MSQYLLSRGANHLPYRSRDVNLLLLMRGIRGFGYGFLNTALGLYLAGIGYSLLQIGLVVTAAGLSSAMLVLISGILSDRVNNRRIFLIFSSVLMSALGAVYAGTSFFPLLLIGAALGGAGSAGAGGPGGGPFGPVQQSLLADKVEDEERNRVFSTNAFVGTALFGIGAIFAGLPEMLSSLGFGRIQVYQWFFLMFMILGLVTALLSYMIHDVKLEKHEQSKEKTRLIGKFTATATLNGFGMGFIPLPLLTLWFSLMFHASESSISLMISASTLASALSFLLAPRLTKRIGSVRMIVSTRVAGIILLASLPIVPLFAVAFAVYVLRTAFVSVGMPIRQSYMMGVMDSEERATAVGVSSGVGWGVPYAVSPVISGFVMQEVSSSLPLYVSALLQTANSIVYYGFFHGIRPPEEKDREHV